MNLTQALRVRGAEELMGEGDETVSDVLIAGRFTRLGASLDIAWHPDKGLADDGDFRLAIALTDAEIPLSILAVARSIADHDWSPMSKKKPAAH